MYELQEWATVLQVYKATGLKEGSCKDPRHFPNKVRHLLKLKGKPAIGMKAPVSFLNRYKDKIIEWSCDPPGFNSTRIFSELKVYNRI